VFSVALLALVACGAAPLPLAALDDVERVRSSAGAREGAQVAPETFARAEQERDWARRSHAAGDEVGATLHAERAVAAYGHALAVARYARAGTELADAQKSLADATAQSESLDASRAKLDQEATELERRLQVERERLLPAPSGSASTEREAARLVSARALAAEARLLCDATSLVAGDAPGLADARKALGTLEPELATTGRAPKPGRSAIVDDAGRARSGCLEVLTRTRRANPARAGEGRSDALLAELSASGGWDPARDERGVVLRMFGAYRGVLLTDEAQRRLQELGRVASAHPDFAVQVVVHDAAAPPPGDDGDARRADAATRALVAGGATAARVQGEAAGARLPIVDPNDPALRARNERLEIVFVASVR